MSDLRMTFADSGACRLIPESIALEQDGRVVTYTASSDFPAALQPAEAGGSAAPNSRYATALKVALEFTKTDFPMASDPWECYTMWLRRRLNAPEQQAHSA